MATGDLCSKNGKETGSQDQLTTHQLWTVPWWRGDSEENSACGSGTCFSRFLFLSHRKDQNVERKGVCGEKERDREKYGEREAGRERERRREEGREQGERENK